MVSSPRNKPQPRQEIYRINTPQRDGIIPEAVEVSAQAAFPAVPASPGDKVKTRIHRADDRGRQSLPSPAVPRWTKPPKASRVLPSIESAAQTKGNKPRVYEENGEYAAEQDFNTNATGLLRRLLAVYEQQHVAEIVTDLGVSGSEEWQMDYVESALRLFGFAETADCVRVSFLESVKMLENEYPRSARRFAGGDWRMERGVDLLSLFED